MLKVVVLIMINEKDRNFDNLNNALETLIRDEVLKQNVKIRRDIQEIEGGLTALEGKFEESQKPTRGGSAKDSVSVLGIKRTSIFDEPRQCLVGFPEMLNNSIYEIGDTLWRRKAWHSDRKWVCLTRPTDMQRHFTECRGTFPGYPNNTTYNVYMPPTEDLLAKDWVRV